MDTQTAIIILVSLLVSVVALPTTMAVLLNRYPLREGIDDGKSPMSVLEDLDGRMSIARLCREWFGREPQGADCMHLLVLHGIATHWRNQWAQSNVESATPTNTASESGKQNLSPDTSNPSSVTPLPSALDWVTRGNFHLRLTYDSGLFTILLQDDLSGTVVLIDSFSNTAGDYKN